MYSLYFLVLTKSLFSIFDNNREVVVAKEKPIERERKNL
jgi:hypothetical protein